jgi:hypothetical protein
MQLIELYAKVHEQVRLAREHLFLFLSFSLRENQRWATHVSSEMQITSKYELKTTVRCARASSVWVNAALTQRPHDPCYDSWQSSCRSAGATPIPWSTSGRGADKQYVRQFAMPSNRNNDA